MKTSAMVTPSGVNASVTPYRARGAPSQPFGAQIAVRVIPATAVGSAKGRSMSASTMRRPGKSYRTSTHATSMPNTAFTVAAASDAPRLNLYEATTRGSVIVSTNTGQLVVAVFIGSVISGTSTISVR